MNNQLVLASTSIILAIYIVGSLAFSYWSGQGKQGDYNIGCYVVNHPLNRTDQLLNRISDLSHLEHLSQLHVSLQSNPTFDDRSFHNQSVQLALSFDKYIKKFTQQHDSDLDNIKILREISKAQKEYLLCKKEVDQSYSQPACKDNWKEYLDCSSKMKMMGKKLQRLTEEQDFIQQQIAEMVKMPDYSISALDLAKKIYKEGINSNQKLKNDILNQLGPLEKKLRTTMFEKEEIVQKYQLTYKNYRQCQDHKKKHNACQQISKEVRKINSENIAYLKGMMESKKELLKNLQRIMNSQKNSKEVEQLNEKYNKHREEYISIWREFISLTRQNEKACGCTAELQQQLKMELEKLKNKEIALKAQIEELKSQIDRLNLESEKCEQDREEIIRRYKNALEQNEKAPRDSQSELSKINRNLRNKFTQILELKSLYKNIDSECEKIKERMGKRVQQIGEVNDCIGKKHYLLELKKQAAPFIHSEQDDLSRMVEGKRELGRSLQAFAKL